MKFRMVMLLLVGLAICVGGLSASPVIEKSKVEKVFSVENESVEAVQVAIDNSVIVSDLEVSKAVSNPIVSPFAFVIYSDNMQGKYRFNFTAKYNYINNRSKHSNYLENYRGWHNPGSNLFQRKV